MSLVWTHQTSMCNFEKNLATAVPKTLHLMVQKAPHGVGRVFDNFNQKQRFGRQLLHKREAKKGDNLNSALSQCAFELREPADVQHVPLELKDVTPEQFLVTAPVMLDIGELIQKIGDRADYLVHADLVKDLASKVPTGSSFALPYFEPDSEMKELHTRMVWTMKKKMNKHQGREVDGTIMLDLKAQVEKPEWKEIHSRVQDASEWKPTCVRSLPIKKLDTMHLADVKEY